MEKISLNGTGILLPMSALPSRYGIGSLGAPSRDFVEILAAAGQRYWQVLPLQPTGFGDSPYQSCSAFALSPYYIDIDVLFNKGLLSEDERKSAEYDTVRVDYSYLFNHRLELLKRAFERFDVSNSDFLAFVCENPELSDYALYMAVKEKNGHKPWYEWEKALRIPTAKKLLALKEEYKKEINFWLFTQYEFFCQFNELKSFAAAKGVEFIGDLPIYVSLDSADVWLNPKLFLLDKNRCPKAVAGVPPDYFSADGQYWGNPLYDYRYMKKDGYAWWKRRISYTLKFFSALRIDHFRGFDRFYSIAAGESTAKNGEWKKAPGIDLFKDMLDLPIIAEDLGILDEGVYKLMKATAFPGMKVLSFAFDSNPQNPYKPSNFKTPNSVAYTGTHDNEPLLTFAEAQLKTDRVRYISDINLELKRAKIAELDINSATASDIVRVILKLLYSSKAMIKIAPAQDILQLGKGYRTNHPSTISLDNWSFRLTKEQLEGVKAYFIEKD